MTRRAFASEVAINAYGRCLVATADVPRGTVVAQFEGPEVPLALVPPEELVYVLFVADNKYLIPRSSARYINHGCDPTCRVLDGSHEVVTLRDVRRGEELTITYNVIDWDDFVSHPDDYVWDDAWSFDCQCSAPGCQRRIDRYVFRDGLTVGQPRLAVRPSPRGGRGVFAVERLWCGQVVERAPVLVVPAAQVPLVDRTALYDYYYAWGTQGRDSEAAAIALGCGSLYNHSPTPALRYERDLAAGCIVFTALRDVAPGEELTINYNDSQDDRWPLWFEARP